jgi:hypothetical protein
MDLYVVNFYRVGYTILKLNGRNQKKKSLSCIKELALHLHRITVTQPRQHTCSDSLD